MLIDTHCHIHEADYPLDASGAINRAHQAGVQKMICVGTDLESSHQAVDFVKNKDDIFAAIGVHPHYAGADIEALKDMLTKKDNKLVGVGEIGLDYFYDHTSHEDQIATLEAQIDLAIKYNLPIIFHVREAFDDFWPVINNFKAGGFTVRGVLHSFTDNKINAEKGLSEGLFIGLNGFVTFTKDEAQKEMFAMLPMDKILLETDAPFLTPVPFRGKVNEPAFVREIAEFCSKLRGVSEEEIANATTLNARELFGL